MRIAYLSHFYPPTHNSGIEQYTHGLAKGMLEAGHSVAVLCVNRWSEGETYWQGFTDDEWEGVSVRRFNVNCFRSPAPNRYYYDNPELADHVRDFLLEYKPDLVHIASMYTLSARIIKVAKELDLPVVFTLSDFWAICPRHTLMRYDGSLCDAQVPPQVCQDCLLSESSGYRALKHLLPFSLTETIYNRLVGYSEIAGYIPGMKRWGMDVVERRRILKQYLPMIDATLAPSQFMRDTTLAAGLPVQIEVSHHGNDLGWLSDYKPRPSDGELHFGYIGQISPIKGLHLLIEAFQRNQFQDHVKLHIYGNLEANPAYVEKLRQLAGQNHNIELMGPFLRHELPRVLADIDALVAPSIWPEVAGLVVQEAFAAKIPVLASDMGGLPEFVRPGAGGLLFGIDNPEELQQTLATVVAGGMNLLDDLRATIPAVRTVDDERQYIESVYANLLSSKVLS